MSARALEARTTSKNPPNLIWIIMDTARRDHFSTYGHWRPTTPVFDKFASQGTKFTQAVSTAPWTLPSHTSMFTGLYTRTHEANGMNWVYKGAYPLVSELLQSAGFQTAMFTNNPVASPIRGLGRGFEHVTSHDTKHFTDQGAVETNRAVRNWVQTMRDPARPMFMFLNYMEPHHPYTQLPPPDLVRYLGKDEQRALRRIRVGEKRGIFNVNARSAGRVRPTTADQEMINAVYDANIYYLDKRIGELLAYLTEEKILENSIVIIMADHGENLGDYGLAQHQWSVHDTLLRLPMAIKFPEGHLSGTTVDTLVQNVDILPMLAELLELDWPERSLMEGHSFLSGASKRRLAYSEYWPYADSIRMLRQYNPELDLEPFKRVYKVARDTRTKYVWAHDGKHALYDLSTDPCELRDRITEDPETAGKMHDLLQAWLRQPFPSADFDVEKVGLPHTTVIEEGSDTQEALEALGYL